ncbi:MAG: nuclear transport factor 2 family protein [Alphaproteobacteria bacterium]|nr:nuclear transport factor 2 family protein [Alphaproteobacteria bacterium]
MAVPSKKVVKGKKPAPKTTPKKATKAVAAKPKASPKQAAKPAKKSVPAPKAPAPQVKKTVSKPQPKQTTTLQSSLAPTAPVIPPAMQAVMDKSEIAEVIYRFARSLDRIDETLLRSIFHHEATLDLGPGVFQGTANDYIHWVIGVMNGVRSSHHMIGNILTTLEGDVALVESYCQTHIRMDKATGREDLFIGSRYLDRLERNPAGAGGVWKIMHRKQVIDWARTQLVSDLFYHQNPDALWSYRTKTDPSYQMAQFPGNQTNGNKLPSFLGRRYDSKSVKF